MKLVLTANTMENPSYPAFVHDAAEVYPNAAFVICGDLLNVFPEPGEDLKASIFYELYGNLLVEEMQRLHATHFADVAHSSFVGPLRDFFYEGGETFLQGRALASRRYGRVFGELRAALGNKSLYFIPGNMDYPQLTELFAAACPSIHCLNGTQLDVDGLQMAGAGGIPSACQPFAKVTRISPYELSTEAYTAQLKKVWGCDLLLTHVSPAECPPLDAFIRESPVRAVVCRAPFDFSREASDCRGQSRVHRIGQTLVVEVRPFDSPENATFVLDIDCDARREPGIEIFAWRAPMTETEVEHRISA